MSQVSSFINNLKQAQDNEAYIVKEVKAWMNTEVPKQVLREIY